MILIKTNILVVITLGYDYELWQRLLQRKYFSKQKIQILPIKWQYIYTRAKQERPGKGYFIEYLDYSYTTLVMQDKI